MPDAFADELVAAWRRHDEILRFLLAEIPDEGLTAKPAGSRGRDVARVFAHLYRVREGWLHYQRTGKRPNLPRHDKGPPPSREELAGWIEESGEAIAAWLPAALAGEAKTRMFGGSPVRWIAYLISHESHHRGQIALALKQSGMRLPDKVALDGLWGKWIHGK